MIDFKDKKIMIFGAHPDDIEFGMGGTLNQLRNNDVLLIILSNTLNYNGNDGILKELDSSMAMYGMPNKLFDFTNMNFPLEGTRIRDEMNKLKNSFKPDIVFSTSPKSVNPDHAEVGLSVKAVFQEQSILFYEVLRGDYEHLPEFYNELSFDDMMQKIQAIECYKTQQNRGYAKPDRVTSFAQMRGAQMNANYAESFEVNRLVRKKRDKK